MPHNDFETDDAEIERKPAMPKGEWILGMCGIGAILLFGFGLGVSLGQSKTELKAKVAAEVAQNETARHSLPEAELSKPKTEPTKPKAEPTKPAPKPPEPMVTPVLFAEKINAIFKLKCNACHGDPSIKGGLDLRSLASIAKGGDNSGGPAVIAKEPGKSLLWEQIESGAMPPAGKEKLTAAEMKLIKDWILSGAK